MGLTKCPSSSIFCPPGTTALARTLAEKAWMSVMVVFLRHASLADTLRAVVLWSRPPHLRISPRLCWELWLGEDRNSTHLQNAKPRAVASPHLYVRCCSALHRKRSPCLTFAWLLAYVSKPSQKVLEPPMVTHLRATICAKQLSFPITYHCQKYEV